MDTHELQYETSAPGAGRGREAEKTAHAQSTTMQAPEAAGAGAALLAAGAGAALLEADAGAALLEAGAGVALLEPGAGAALLEAAAWPAPADLPPPDLRGGFVYVSCSVSTHGGRVTLDERKPQRTYSSSS